MTDDIVRAVLADGATIGIREALAARSGPVCVQARDWLKLVTGEAAKGAWRHAPITAADVLRAAAIVSILARKND